MDLFDKILTTIGLGIPAAFSIWSILRMRRADRRFKAAQVEVEEAMAMLAKARTDEEIRIRSQRLDECMENLKLRASDF